MFMKLTDNNNIKNNQQKDASSLPFPCSNFNGKEKDWESGFHYYGARYYWSEVQTGWLSVDPMMDKNPSISPYAYCIWNPIKLIDPDGEWPWDPKHIREARNYAHKNGGTLNIWKERNGVKLASVTSAEKTTSCEVSVSITLFQPTGYTSRGEIKQASGLSNIEMWMDSPSENVIDAAVKGAASIAYGVPNDISKLITGKTIAGSDVSSTEKEEAFAGTATSILSPLLKGTGIITRTNAKKGLQGYNEFIKKNPGIIQRRSRKGAGNAFKINQIQQEGLVDFRMANEAIQGAKEVRNGVDK